MPTGKITQSTSISRINVRISVEETESTTPFKDIDSLLMSSSEQPRTYQILIAHPAYRAAPIRATVTLEPVGNRYSRTLAPPILMGEKPVRNSFISG